MKLFISILISVLFSSVTIAQKEANYWFFGQNAGLNFSNGSPVAITDGALSTMEGCSSISSATGMLQFYTDGTNVWNRDNAIMSNGYNLMGDASSTQSAIIVPRPGSTNLYYIFTVDDVANGNGGTNGLRYSLVDMTLSGWKGDVVSTVKNVLLTAPLCEKVTAVGHANGVDTWVIAPKWGTNSFYSYLVTADGVNEDPVISSVGDVISGQINNAKGYMKVSPDGDKIAKANAGMGTVEIFDYNNSTGIVSNVLKDNIYGTDPYGIEFSPNSSLLYVGSWYVGAKYLYQYNLDAGTPQGILDSRVLIATGTEGALQMGPDNKIYAAQNQSGSISVIHNPNEIGVDCSFEWGVVSLGGQVSRWGLPPFIQSFFSFNAGFYNTSACFGTTTQFTENSSQQPDSVLWNFGNAASGSANTSTESDPEHLFTSPGFYPVTLTVWITGVEVSVTHMVVVNDIPDVSLPSDTAMCAGNYYTIDAGDGFYSYLWQNGDTLQSITVNSTGSYWVEVATMAGCSDRDTVDVTFYSNPIAEAGSTQTIMQGATTFLEGEVSSGSGNYTFEWLPSESLVQNNILNPETVVLEIPTVFTLYIEDDNGCVAEPDEVLINIEGAFLSAYPMADPDSICYGESVTISANATGGAGEYYYSWTSDPEGYNYSVPDFTIVPEVGTTKLFLTVTDQYSNSFSQSVDVVVNPLPVVNLIPQGSNYSGDTIIVCVRDSVWLDAGFDNDPEGTTYFWESLLYEGRYYNATTNGAWIDFQSQDVLVTHGGSGCQSSGDVTIMFDFNECSLSIPESEDEDIKFVDLYPNPNNGKFTLLLNQVSNNVSAKVYDISGRLIYQNKWIGRYNKGEKLDMPIIINENGIYLVYISSDETTTILKMFVQ